MKQTHIFALIVGSLLFLSTCTFEGLGGGNSPIWIAASEIDVGGNNRASRGDRSSNARKCENNNDCVDVCEEVYDVESSDADNEAIVERCLDLRSVIALEFDALEELLEEPRIQLLRKLEDNVFKQFLSISVGPWVKEITDDIDDDEAEILLTWIAESDKC